MPAILESCVQKLINEGHEKSSAYAICTASLQKAGKLSEEKLAELRKEIGYEQLSDESRTKIDSTLVDMGLMAEPVTKLGELKGVEILSVGAIPSRNLNFTRSDLKEIAANTNLLLEEQLHNPPGKLGHDDAQVFARESGLPATGWAHKLRVVGDKLLADFKEVPPILMKAFEEKLYRKISSEVYFGFKHPKTQQTMGKVLRAVAFLGQDIPQVKGLADFLSEHPTPYSLVALDKLAECHAMAELNITINVPDSPTKGAPGPITAEGLAGREMELYRQAEQIAGVLKPQGIQEFAQDASVESMLRYVGRVGAMFCASSPEFRQMSDNPEELSSWLQERARERGYVATPLADTPHQEEKVNMDDKKKIEELSEQLTAAQSKSTASEQEATTLKAQIKTLTEQIAAKRKEQLDAEIKTFVETHKAVIIPAIEPLFRALCESAGEGEVEVKLSEKPEKLGRVALAFKFAEAMAKAKVVPLGEVKKDKDGKTIEVKPVKDANFRTELHEATMIYLAEKGIDKPTAKEYIEAAKTVSRKNPEMADAA